ncbi:MAG TPA: DinB family protein [Vicinamibacterales bacterium]|nr:DinB family protein [Vicinamibacterales bacterium]
MSLLEPLLDSWDRNNTILINLLRAVPDDALDIRATASGPSVAQLFAHIHYVRLVFVEEDAPEHARPLPAEEWAEPPSIEGIVRDLAASAQAVRDAVRGRIDAGRGMDMHYDHPILMLQHLIWHEGYHHGQIKLALKLAGRPIANEVAGPLTWRVWMQKT